MNIEFFQKRKTELEDAFLLKSRALDMLDYLKVRCIDNEQYCAIRDYIEASAMILESDLGYVNGKLQSKYRPSYSRNKRLTRAQSKLLPDLDH